MASQNYSSLEVSSLGEQFWCCSVFFARTNYVAMYSLREQFIQPFSDEFTDYWKISNWLLIYWTATTTHCFELLWTAYAYFTKLTELFTTSKKIHNLGTIILEILKKLVASKPSMWAEAYAYDTCHPQGYPLPPSERNWEASSDHCCSMVSSK